VRKSQNKISVRVDFEGEEADKVDSLCKARGLKNKSELVRQLITEAFQRQKTMEVPA